jgi:hypothetical protein
MQRIIEANIERFKKLLLETENDPKDRAVIGRLLTEWNEKLKAVKKPEAIQA